jgi:hypothetical protein
MAWASGAPLLLIRALLGLESSGEHLLVEPALPKTISRLEVLDIPGVWGCRDAFGRARAELNGAGRASPCRCEGCPRSGSTFWRRRQIISADDRCDCIVRKRVEIPPLDRGAPPPAALQPGRGRPGLEGPGASLI